MAICFPSPKTWALVTQILKDAEKGNNMPEHKTIWVYIKSEPQLWTVGFYDPAGAWHSDSDHATPEKAAERVHYLNGGQER